MLKVKVAILIPNIFAKLTMSNSELLYIFRLSLLLRKLMKSCSVKNSTLKALGPAPTISENGKLTKDL